MGFLKTVIKVIGIVIGIALNARRVEAFGRSTPKAEKSNGRLI